MKGFRLDLDFKLDSKTRDLTLLEDLKLGFDFHDFRVDLDFLQGLETQL